MKSHKHFFLKYVVVAGLICFRVSPSHANAEPIEPQDVTISTPVYHPEFGKIDYPLGTYKYTVSWEGIPAAEATTTIEQDGLHYKITAKAKTYSGIDLLYKLRYNAESTLSAVDFLPVKTQISEQENSKHKRTEIRYLENGDISSVRSQVGKDTKSLQFDPNNFTLEPFSASFIARGLNWSIGKTAEFDTFNGKTRYLIKLTAIDKIMMGVNGVDKEVWVISPHVHKLTDTDASKDNKKLRQARIYVTADKEREILQIDSEVFIGTVKTKLDSFTPSTNIPGTNVARIEKPIKMVF